jgi:phosphoribosylformylglycinamidine cyclo-ligase
MLDNATQSVLDEIKKTDLPVSNSLYKTVGTPNYFASVVDTNQNYIATAVDGVGSKIEHLIKHEMYSEIGKDCFAMCYNDLLCVGANPIGFSDHITSTQNDSHIIPQVISGILDYCGFGFTVLTGGETEILPQTNFHISGSIMGTVQKNNLIDGSRVEPGDVIIGLPSSGIHANGWTAISKRMPELISPECLTATKLYTREIMTLRARVESPCAIVNITGGGFRNLERIPKNVQYELTFDYTPAPFQDLGCEFSHQELYTTFNMGIGMMVIVKMKDLAATLDSMENSRVIGGVVEASSPKVVVNGQDIYFGDTVPYVEDTKEITECNINLTDN